MNDSPRTSNPQAAVAMFDCPWCPAINDATLAAWCDCLTARPTLACATCCGCFCGAPADWRFTFMTSDAAIVFRSRAAQRSKNPSALMMKPQELPGPVIMVVDDDKVVHVIAKRVLAEFGGTLLHAEDGESARQLALRVRPDLVITDALLPKLDGRELSRILKTTAETQHCKVAVMTALYKGTRYRAEAFKKFLVDYYVEKPLTPVALREVASTLLPLTVHGMLSGKSNSTTPMLVVR